MVIPLYIWIMLVTINTDASHCHENSIGAFAFWIKSGLCTIKKSGVLKGEIKSAGEAEFKAIANAAHALLTSKQKVTKVIINTDCLNVIKYMRGEVNGGLLYNKLKTSFYNCIPKNCIVEFRHVKAHTKNQDSRSYVNNWCDTMAKTELRNQRQKIKSYASNNNVGNSGNNRNLIQSAIDRADEIIKKKNHKFI